MDSYAGLVHAPLSKDEHADVTGSTCRRKNKPTLADSDKSRTGTPGKSRARTQPTASRNRKTSRQSKRGGAQEKNRPAINRPRKSPCRKTDNRRAPLSRKAKPLRLSRPPPTKNDPESPQNKSGPPGLRPTARKYASPVRQQPGRPATNNENLFNHPRDRTASGPPPPRT